MLLVASSTLFLNESYVSASNITSLMSLLSPFMSLPTHLPVQHKLHPFLIHSTISCSLWSLTLHLETCCWFQGISMPVSGLTSSPGGLSLVHMAWVTAMAMVRDCLISAQITSFLSPIPGLITSPSTKPPGSEMEIVQGLVISLITF